MIQSQNLGGIFEQLTRERQKLQGQLETAKRTVHHIESELARMDQALMSLRGEVAPAARRAGGRRKALTGAEVASLVERVLREDGRLTEKRLLERLGERAKADGRSKQGIHLRYKKALSEGPFQFNGAHWELRG